MLPVSLLHNFTTFFTRLGGSDRVLWMPWGEGEQQWQPKNSRYSLQPFFFHSKAQSSLLLGESHCFQSSLIKHVSKANLVSLFQTPASGLIINLVPFLIANLVSQGLHKGDIRGQAGSQSLFQQSWSKGVSLVSNLIIFYPEFLKELWFPRVVKCKKNKNLIHYFSTFFAETFLQASLPVWEILSKFGGEGCLVTEQIPF